MEKTKPAVKRQLKEQWEKACNGYLTELLRMWELDAFYAYWIGDEVGGVLDYGGGAFTIGMDDIIYCVEHNVSEQQYQEWQEYIIDAAEFGFDTPNLRSWHMGCPRVQQATFNRLRSLKKDLADAVAEEQHRQKHNNQP